MGKRRGVIFKTVLLAFSSYFNKCERIKLHKSAIRFYHHILQIGTQRDNPTKWLV